MRWYNRIAKYVLQVVDSKPIRASSLSLLVSELKKSVSEGNSSRYQLEHWHNMKT
jgi:hypothetical protein